MEPTAAEYKLRTDLDTRRTRFEIIVSPDVTVWVELTAVQLEALRDNINRVLDVFSEI